MSKGNPRVYTRLSRETFEQLQNLAKERDIDVSTLLREAINVYLSTCKAENA